MTQTDVPQLDSYTAWEELIQADKIYVSVRMELSEAVPQEVIPTVKYELLRRNQGRPEGIYLRLPQPASDSRQEDEKINSLFAALQQSDFKRFEAFKAVMSTGDVLLELLKDALMDPRQRGTAIFVAQALPPERLEPVLPELLALATSFNGYAEAAKKLVLSLSKDSLITHVERFTETMLPEASYEEYGGLIALYSQIDQKLALGLAQQAARHEDEDIRETGEDYLLKYQPA